MPKAALPAHAHGSKLTLSRDRKEAVVNGLIALALVVALLVPVAAAADKKEEVLVTFSGLLKSITKKQIVIEPEPDNQMTFVRSRRTKFMKGDHQIDSSAVTPGSVVSIQAFEKLNRDLEAVTVTITDAAAQSPNK